MAKPPRAVGPLLCRDVRFVPTTATMSLVGLFNSRTYSQWPSPPDPFFFYTLLVGGQGDGEMEFLILNAATEQLVYRFSRWYAVPSPVFQVHFIQKIQRCIFPHAGRYLITLRFDQSIVTQRPLDVYRDRTP